MVAYWTEFQPRSQGLWIIQIRSKMSIVLGSWLSTWPSYSSDHAWSYWFLSCHFCHPIFCNLCVVLEGVQSKHSLPFCDLRFASYRHRPIIFSFNKHRYTLGGRWKRKAWRKDRLLYRPCFWLIYLIVYLLFLQVGKLWRRQRCSDFRILYFNSIKEFLSFFLLLFLLIGPCQSSHLDQYPKFQRIEGMGFFRLLPQQLVYHSSWVSWSKDPLLHLLLRIRLSTQYFLQIHVIHRSLCLCIHHPLADL